MRIEPARRLKQENSRSKRPVADLSLDNAFIEAFNGRLRDECLNENWFLSLEDARDKVKAWREEYNRWRPHSALCNLSPEEFIRMKELVG